MTHIFKRNSTNDGVITSGDEENNGDSMLPKFGGDVPIKHSEQERFNRSSKSRVSFGYSAMGHNTVNDMVIPEDESDRKFLLDNPFSAWNEEERNNTRSNVRSNIRNKKGVLQQKKSRVIELTKKFSLLKEEFPLILQEFPSDLNPSNFKEEIARECFKVFGSAPETGLQEFNRNQKIDKHLLQFRIISKLEGAIVKNYFKTWKENSKKLTQKNKIEKDRALEETSEKLVEKLKKRKNGAQENELQKNLYQSNVKLEKEKASEGRKGDVKTQMKEKMINPYEMDDLIESKLPMDNIKKFLPFCNDVIINKKYLI